MRGTQDYVCVKCEQPFEYFHMGTDDQVAECPHCQTKSPEHEKKFTLGMGHILKGRGWAKDGYN
jgi:putative FmdB family regulatory protein